MKKVLALTLALVMMVQPMIASAATWSGIMQELHTAHRESGYKTEESVQVTVDDTTASLYYKDGSMSISVRGGKLVFENKDGIMDSIMNWYDEKLPGYVDTYYVFGNLNVDASQINDVVSILSIEDTFVGLLMEDNVAGMENFAIHASEDAGVELLNYGENKITNINMGADANGYVNIDGVTEDTELVPNIGITKTEGMTDEDVVAAMNDFIANSLTVNGEKADVNDIDLFVVNTYNEQGDFTGVVFLEVDPATGELRIEGSAAYVPGEAEPEEEPYDDLKAQREAEEALRQARGIGGVTTSIFWNKQMYLGHSTYNGRVYYQGKTEMTLQSLSWLPGGSANGKDYTLRINKENVNPGDVEIRLAQDILDVCKRAGIAQITIVDKNLAPIAQYAVSDLMAAREMYGLTADELICISADANAEVMKVTAEGEYLPIEPAAEEAAE